MGTDEQLDENGISKRTHGATRHQAISAQYPRMREEQLCALPVTNIAAKDAVLFLWATAPCLDQAFPVMRAWGFNYRTVAFVWVKTSKNVLRPFTLRGNYTLPSTEFCLLGKRGNLRRTCKTVHQVVYALANCFAGEEHSTKPAIFRDKILKLYGDLPRVELFARQRVPGWAAWGNEIDSDITLEVPP